VIALDLRNHGASPWAAAMDYPALATDVAESMAALGAPRAAVIGHSMGGKVAMVLALTRPAAVERLIVADVAPVAYPPRLRPLVAAMQALLLHPGLTRREADAALATAVPEPGIRGFLLQNLRLGAGAAPAWRLNLAAIAAALPGIEGFPDEPGHHCSDESHGSSLRRGTRLTGWADPADRLAHPSASGHYAGPVLVLAGGRSDYIRPEHHALFRARFPAVRFATIRDAGHWLHAEQPEAFLAAVARFLDSPAPPAWHDS
jgi:esterase